MQLDRGGICHLLMLRHLRHFTRGTSGSVQNTLYVEYVICYLLVLGTDGS